MNISVSKNDDKVTIVLANRFDFCSVEEFRKAYESLQDFKRKNIIIDFQNTQYIDSSALGMLIHAKKYFDKNKVKIILANANEQIRKILSISRFDKKFEIK